MQHQPGHCLLIFLWSTLCLQKQCWVSFGPRTTKNFQSWGQSCQKNKALPLCLDAMVQDPLTSDSSSLQQWSPAAGVGTIASKPAEEVAHSKCTCWPCRTNDIAGSFQGWTFSSQGLFGHTVGFKDFLALGIPFNLIQCCSWACQISEG